MEESSRENSPRDWALNFRCTLARQKFARRSRNYEGINQGGETAEEGGVEGKKREGSTTSWTFPRKFSGNRPRYYNRLRGGRAGGRVGGWASGRDKRGLKVDEDPGDIGTPVKRNQNSN